MEKAGSIDTDKVKAALDDMKTCSPFTAASSLTPRPRTHGLQIGHEMIYIQWQKDPQGKP